MVDLIQPAPAPIPSATPSARKLRFDPQGHQLGPIATIAAQASLILGMGWAFGALAGLFLPPSLSLLTLMPVMGAMVLAPRSTVMQFPVSFSVLGIFSISIASLIWTIDGVNTLLALRGLIPAMLAIILAAGLLTLRDLTDALVWTVWLVLAVTVAALVLDPSTRVHEGGGPTGDDYAGWHGFFTHKNQMTPFFVLGIPTILTFQKPGILKWTVLGMIGVLMVGSTSATGISAGFFAAVAWVWFRLYQSQEDTRNSTLLFSMSLVGAIGVVAVGVSSIATITSAYGKDTTFSGRTDIWEASWAAFLERPWLGYGFAGLFGRENLTPKTAAIWRHVGFEASHAHNGALDLALQIGLIGLAIFAVLWISTFRSAWQRLDTLPGFSVWVLSVLAANFVMSLSEDVFFGGWIAAFALMKMMLIRRPEVILRPSYRDGPIAKWA